MNFLLDTQILIWVLEGSNRLSDEQKAAINDIRFNKYVSHVSFMEIAIKLKINKLPKFLVDVEAIISETKEAGFTILPLENKHISNYSAIPFFDNYRDPFDRFLISIAQSENLKVISSDEKFDLYNNLVVIIK